MGAFTFSMGLYCLLFRKKNLEKIIFLIWKFSNFHPNALKRILLLTLFLTTSSASSWYRCSESQRFEGLIKNSILWFCIIDWISVVFYITEQGRSQGMTPVILAASLYLCLQLQLPSHFNDRIGPKRRWTRMSLQTISGSARLLKSCG
jgi:hypothetical protein